MDWNFDEVRSLGSMGGPVYGLLHRSDGGLLVTGGNSSGIPYAVESGSESTWPHPDTQSSHGFKRGLRRPLEHDGVVYVPGEWGLLASTQDDGQTWRHIETESESCFYRVVEDTDGGMLAFSDAGVFSSRDGEEWTCEYRERCLGVLFLEDCGLVFGHTISIREGGAYRPSALRPTATLCGMARSPSGVLILVGDGGQAYRSHDTGESWEPIRAPNVDLEDAISTSTGVLVVGASGTMLHTEDDGDTWEKVKHPYGKTHFWVLAPGDRAGEILMGAAKGLVVRLSTDSRFDDLDDLD